MMTLSLSFLISPKPLFSPINVSIIFPETLYFYCEFVGRVKWPFEDQEFTAKWNSHTHIHTHTQMHTEINSQNDF